MAAGTQPADDQGTFMAGLREAMSYAVPGGSGMRRRRVVVSVRCGEQSIVEDCTDPDGVGGRNPVWKKKDGRRLALRRTALDKGIGVVGVFQCHESGQGSRKWLGGNHFDFTPALDAPNEPISLELPLFVSGTPQGGAGSGMLNLTYKWVPAAEPTSLEDRVEASEEVDVAAQGELVVVIRSARGLLLPDRIIRDVTTFVDTGPLMFVAFAMALYLLGGMAFYAWYLPRAMSVGGDARFEGLEERLTGGHGQWDALNSAVFMVTSFTTVGFGNHPSLVATLPPCEVPGPQLLIDNPFSTLLPREMRFDGAFSQDLSGQDAQQGEFPPLPASCFGAGGQGSPGCLVIADDDYIFDFESLLLWRRRGAADPPRNLTGRGDELALLRVPGNLGLYGEAGLRPQAEAGELHARFARTCSEQLVLWRTVEGKKDLVKVFTSIFILIGMALLGALVGAVGEALMDWIHGLMAGVEYTVDTASDVATPLTKKVGDVVGGAVSTVAGAVDIESVARGSKGVVVAFLALGVVISGGTAVYSVTESLKIVDAVYFTIVTITTVGFGDYCPESYYGRLFTVVFVPFSVVATAGAINWMARIPLQSRRDKMAKYVLAQFGDNPSEGDFDDVRHSALLLPGKSIRSNDFVVAMALRMGYMNNRDFQNIKRVFAQLDKSDTGELSVEAIAEIAAASTNIASDSGEFLSPIADAEDA